MRLFLGRKDKRSVDFFFLGVPGEREKSSFFSPRLTVKVAGILLRLKLRDKLGFLPQETVPVQINEKPVLLHLKRTS